VISKAKTACKVSGQRITDHFVDVNRMVDLGSCSQREINNIMHKPRPRAKSSLRPNEHPQKTALLA
jgi:hypothetical protein